MQSKYSLFQSNHLQKTKETIALGNGSLISETFIVFSKSTFKKKVLTGSIDNENGIIILTD